MWVAMQVWPGRHHCAGGLQLRQRSPISFPENLQPREAGACIGGKTAGAINQYLAHLNPMCLARQKVFHTVRGGRVNDTRPVLRRDVVRRNER